MSVNKVILLGNIGSELELAYAPSGQAVCKFSLATNENWKDKKTGDKQQKTTWHRIVIWGQKAEVANKYLNKGQQVFLEGKIDIVNWVDKKTDSKRYATDIIVDKIDFISSKSSDDQPKQNILDTAAKASTPKADDTFTHDDIPF